MPATAFNDTITGAGTIRPTQRKNLPGQRRQRHHRRQGSTRRPITTMLTARRNGVHMARRGDRRRRHRDRHAAIDSRSAGPTSPILTSRPALTAVARILPHLAPSTKLKGWAATIRLPATATPASPSTMLSMGSLSTSPPAPHMGRPPTMLRMSAPTRLPSSMRCVAPISRTSIFGDANANTLEGRGGNDILDGRGGADVLVGGTGADTFVYAKGYGATDDFGFRSGRRNFQSS